MSFRPVSFSPKTKYTKQIKKFLGVDYSTQKFLVGDGRAIDLLNYLYKDGVIQKRNGVEELFKVEEFKSCDKINIDDAARKITIAHENFSKSFLKYYVNFI